MKFISHIAILIALMILLVLLENFTDIDTLISNNFYNFEKHQWVIDYEEHKRLSPFLYEGAKSFVAFIGTLCVLYMLASVGIKKWRQNFAAVMTVLLCTIAIPTCVGKLKNITNVYCPDQLEIYNAQYPYVKLLQKYPKNFIPKHKGRCFPAGHVSGAFSLMSLFFVFKNKKRRYAALGFAVSFGGITGIYQMSRGEHFITHNLFSMLIAATLIIIIYSNTLEIVEYVKKRCKKRIQA